MIRRADMQICPWCRNDAERRRVDGVLDVGVAEHDQRVVAAELEHDALEVAGPPPRRACRPVAVEPVKLIRRTAGFSTSSSPIGAASPGACVTMFSTPAGRPGLGEDLAPDQAADERRPLGRLEHDGVAERERRGDRARREDQRRVPRRDRADDADRLPDAHRERPGCPTGSPRRSARTGAPPPAGAARARSGAGTSRSRSVRPVSRASSATTSSARRSRMSAALRKIACRAAGGVCDHAGNAAAAASTARRASSRPPAGTRATTSPVNGSRSSKVLAAGGVRPLAADEVAVLLDLLCRRRHRLSFVPGRLRMFSVACRGDVGPAAAERRVVRRRSCRATRAEDQDDPPPALLRCRDAVDLDRPADPAQDRVRVGGEKLVPLLDVGLDRRPRSRASIAEASDAQRVEVEAERTRREEDRSRRAR